MAKKGNSGLVGIAFFIMSVLTIFILMVTCEGNSEKKSKYDGAYWRSIEREKQFKDAGLDEYAKRERRERRKKLRNQ